jgi:hypothetical protein
MDKKIVYLKLLKYTLLITLSVLPRFAFSQSSADQFETYTKVYKTIKKTKLNLYIYQPCNHKEGQSLSTIVFFHGGGWGGGHAWQFIPQCKYLAESGMVAISAEYRVRKRQGVTPFECVSDAKSAIRWVRIHAKELGIDENRCEVIPFEGRGHGFFNYSKEGNPDFLTTMEKTKDFLTSFGYLKK